METNQIKRLLVVSENPGLCKYLLSVMEELGLTKSWRVAIKYTVYNDNPAAVRYYLNASPRPPMSLCHSRIPKVLRWIFSVFLI